MPFNEKAHFEQIKNKINNYVAVSEFKRDLKNKSLELAYIMDIVNSEHSENEQLHKFEMSEGKAIFFRAKIKSIHILYAYLDGTIFFLRAFKDFTDYKRILSNPKQLLRKVEEEKHKF